MTVVRATYEARGRVPVAQHISRLVCVLGGCYWRQLPGIYAASDAVWSDQHGTLDVAHCYVRAPIHISFRSFALRLLSALLLSPKGRWIDPLMPSFRRMLFCNSE